jgi:proteasome lid subunit RPN8/RPN11
MKALFAIGLGILGVVAAAIIGTYLKYLHDSDAYYHPDKDSDIDEDVLNEIINTIGTMEPEQGGLLGKDENGKIVTFLLDENGSKTGHTYSPDKDWVNEKLKEWEQQGIKLAGIVHSHPCYPNDYIPSKEDVEYAARIIEAMPETLGGIFHMPIVTINDGYVRLTWWVVTNEGLTSANIISHKDGFTENHTVNMVRKVVNNNDE